MNYKSFYDLSQDIKANLFKIPRNVSLVAGVPRSGLLAANIIALYLNLPLTDIESLGDGKILSAGQRFENKGPSPFDGTILVVDDSIYSGAALQKAKHLLMKAEGKKYDILYCCVYVMPGLEELIDIPMVILDEPRVFEWNIFHHACITQACVDIDGVLCIDPSEGENDDGVIYRRFLENAVPKFLPTVKINCLVTSRLEKYRPETERWLAANNIIYDELVMLDLPDKETRQRLGCHATFKAQQYNNRKKAILFIESSAGQARQIFEITGKPVYCVDSNEMYSKSVPLIKLAIKKISNKKNIIKSALKKIFKSALKKVLFKNKHLRKG